jgi:predicted MPP superfamily phosphohydrolase
MLVVMRSLRETFRRGWDAVAALWGRLPARLRRVLTAPGSPLGRKIAAVIAVAAVGLWLGAIFGGHETRQVGPFQAELSIHPSWTGDTSVKVPPLGSLTFDSHDGPVRLEVRVDQVRQDAAQRIVADPQQLRVLSDQAVDDARSAVIWLVVKTVLCSLVAVTLLGLALFRRNLRRLLLSVVTAVAVLVGTAGVGAATFRPGSVNEPQYHGLLVDAPNVIGNTKDLAGRFNLYRAQLAQVVTNLTKIYQAVATLPTFEPEPNMIRVLHVSDLHLNPTAFSLIASLVKQYKIDVVADTGDLTDWGTEPEGRFVSQIGTLNVPYVFVRGNHDSTHTAAEVATQPNAVVLDNTIKQVAGLTFAGIGDPRYTPDKTTRDDNAPVSEVIDSGKTLDDTIKAQLGQVDIAMAHDPSAGPPMAGHVPLVLSGHTHKRSTRQLDKGTLELVEGSTGGAGLRGLEGEKPTPLECSVLYFDSTTHLLTAYDEITLGGLGTSEASISRRLAPAAKGKSNPEPQQSGQGSAPP